MHTDVLRNCATVFRDNMGAVVSALLDGTKSRKENRFQDSPAQLRNRVRDCVALLIEHLRGREDFGALYTGQRMLELTQPEKTREENLAQCRQALLEDEAVYLRALSPHVTGETLDSFQSEYRALTHGLVVESQRHLRTLFIGDCMLGEILAFVVGPLANQGLSIDPFPVNPRDPSQLRRMLSALSTKTFDAIFFSPFSHARLPEIEAMLDPTRALATGAQTDLLVSAIIEQTQALLEEMAKRFECPIFVHNAGMVARANGRAKAATRLLLTRRTRTLAGAQINRWLADYVATVNSMTFPHLFVIDETALVQKFGGVALGQFLNTSAFQHCAVLSQRLAPAYRARLSAVGRLVDKKLVICDLDNTLWDGVIGEGAVVHFMDRQRTLKRLKDHSGVVLSIASKNDPANVRFDGGALNLSDFVAPQISWGQKCAAIAKIKSTLNLQTRHMVFLDDRADERALVKEMFTDLLTLDPCDSETWSQIECWGEISLGSSDLDRTRMYQEQALRDAEIESADAAFARADDETIKKLGLVITIGEAARSDLKRVAELINRTNQWNLCGSRTSFEEVRSWHASEQALVLVARVADRFGDMGTVCVAVVLLHEDDAEIPVFVLSCRVFGYGIESAMLAEIGRRCAIGTRRQALRGRYSSNAQNHPCRNMYADHGFSQLDGVFEWTGAPALPAVPGAEVRLAT